MNSYTFASSYSSDYYTSFSSILTHIPFQSSNHSIHMNIDSDDYEITYTSDMYVGLLTQDNGYWRGIQHTPD
jgi:hypothetical protein